MPIQKQFISLSINNMLEVTSITSARSFPYDSTINGYLCRQYITIVDGFSFHALETSPLEFNSNDCVSSVHDKSDSINYVLLILNVTPSLSIPN